MVLVQKAAEMAAFLVQGTNFSLCFVLNVGT